MYLFDLEDEPMKRKGSKFDLCSNHIGEGYMRVAETAQKRAIKESRRHLVGLNRLEVEKHN